VASDARVTQVPTNRRWTDPGSQAPATVEPVPSGMQAAGTVLAVTSSAGRAVRYFPPSPAPPAV
jgi:hypothetical protein